MPGPVFVTSDAETTRLEGLYIKERLPPAEIQGIALNDVCVVSEAIRGPVAKAVLCGSASRVREVFGGRDQGSGGTATSPLWKALVNKPWSRLWVIRAAAAAAVAASRNFPNSVPTNIIRVDASSVGAWGNVPTIDIQDATDGNVNHFNLKVSYLGQTFTYKNLDCTAGNNNLLQVIGNDDSNLIVVTKLADGRPSNIAAAALNGTAGSDGTIADSDFTASGKGLNVAAGVQNVGCVFIAERMSTALKSAIATLAAASTDRVWLVGPDAETTSKSTAITDVALNRHDRIVYTWGHGYTLDPEIAAEMLIRPESWLASIFSQTDVDQHVGDEETKNFTKGLIRLYDPSLVRGDFIAFKDAGICALEPTSTGHAFVSGVTTSLTPGKEQIARRRCTDFLHLSLAKALAFFVKKKNTLSRRKTMYGVVRNFLDGLKRAERIVDKFEVLDTLNTDITRAQGIEKIFIRVRLIPFMLFIVLETEIGEQVVISEAA
jgi:hypothetical protein